MITHNGKQVTLAMRNRKAINLIARNGKAMFGEFIPVIGYVGIDAAAKAVILAEYGSVVWSDVRDYAKAHPQIVEFINQDPHLACSISPNSNKVRSLTGDGNSYIITHHTIGMHPRIVIEDYYCTIGNACIFQPIVNGALKQDGWVTNPDGNMYYRYGASAWNGTRSMGTITGQRMTLDLSERMIRDGVEYGSTITGYNFTNYKDYNMRIWGAGWAGSKTIEMSRVKMYDDNVQYLELVPCVYNEAIGMLDILTGEFYANQGSGQFTIAITDKE